MTNIRVTYSGLISFAISLISVVTGLIFTVIITRQLTAEEYGIFGVIGGLTGYMLIVEPIVSYWATREIARGEKSGKTALITNTLFSFGTIPIFLLIVFLYHSQVDIDLNILIFAAIMIPSRFLRHGLDSINAGYKPQNVAYGLLIFELIKIPSALALVFYLDMGVIGVIIAITIASIAQVIFQILIVRNVIRVSFDAKFIKKWIKLSWLPVYPRLAQNITNSDIVIFSIIVNSIELVAFWTVSMAIAGVIEHSSSISKAVYPKLLGGGKREFFQDNMNRVLYLSIPLVAMAIVFARPSLFTLNPIYEEAVSIVIILSLAQFLRMLNTTFTHSLTGIDEVDIDEKANYKKYLKSKLFKLPTLKLIQRISYILSLTVILLIFTPIVDNKLDLVFYWAIVTLATQIPLTIIYYSMIKKDFSVKIGRESILKYLFSGIIVFTIIHFLMDKFLVYNENIFKFLPDFFVFVITGITGYILLTYLIDIRTKKLVKSIIIEIKKITGEDKKK